MRRITTDAIYLTSVTLPCHHLSPSPVDSRARFSTPSPPPVQSSPVPPTGTPVATVISGEEPAPPATSQRSSSPGEVPPKGSPPGTTPGVRWTSASGVAEKRKCFKAACGSGTGGNRNRRRSARFAPQIHYRQARPRAPLPELLPPRECSLTMARRESERGSEQAWLALILSLSKDGRTVSAVVDANATVVIPAERSESRDPLTGRSSGTAGSWSWPSCLP